jgi:hypothetical protein
MLMEHQYHTTAPCQQQEDSLDNYTVVNPDVDNISTEDGKEIVGRSTALQPAGWIGHAIW